MSTFQRWRGTSGRPRTRTAQTTRRRFLAGGLVAGSLVAGAAGLTGVAAAAGGGNVLGQLLAAPSTIGQRDADGADSPNRSHPDGGPAAVSVPCDPARLVAALVHADAQGGGTLRLAPKCTYTLTEAAFDDDRFDGGVRDAREASDQLENGENTSNTAKTKEQIRRENSSGLPVVYHPITIEGDGATIARHPNAPEFRFFTVRDGGELKLSDVTLRNGRSVAEGGSVHVVHGGSAVLERTTITQSLSFSAEGGGGAVFNDGNLVVTDSTFTQNAATARTGRGGGLLNGGVLTVTGSTFRDNSAAAIGGGLANFRGAADIGGSTFEHNSATQGGGLASFSARTRVWDTKVTGNTAGNGGGIANSDATIALRGLTVRDNLATGDGGGVWASRGLITLDATVVTANVAHRFGGGLFTDRSNVPVRHSEITGNGAVGATSTGGGIHASGGQVSLFASRVTENRSVVAPGGIFGRNLRVNVDPRSVVTDNRPTNCQGSPAPIGNCFR
ncbi:right-handed parallel beta-helix repeat-containing protein [Micromonospora yangpuensis]|uniref:Right handed beta helix domain-containing protein n=1 Tax=Micromonospora yangpuensis TaxID=683228 RepID=A0A1C6V6F7_9ACTN|nr:right-handed parallel beta-helix repeat-containing protein [Micromonospora yangpuensis]GGM19271.1 hypothetical protein GCM10012279_41950 [Micromonospora yangpuensis]SCL61929.1 hypothetical protein GA0070617_4802 [Micromonospora yangpuensis]